MINAFEKKSTLIGEDDLMAGSENLQSMATVAEMERADLNVMLVPKKSSNMGIVAIEKKSSFVSEDDLKQVDDSTGTKSENYKNEVPVIKNLQITK